MSKQPIVIAISSPPGGGKSKLCEALTRHYSNSSYIDYDCFQNVTEHPIFEICDSLRDTDDYDHFSLPELVQALGNIKQRRPIFIPSRNTTFIAEKLVFFETPFGRAHNEMAAFIDYLIWIDVPLDLALARNFREFLSQTIQSETSLNEFNIWAKQYLSAYVDQVRPLLIDQKAKIASSADYVIDGNQSFEELLDDVIDKCDDLL